MRIPEILLFSLALAADAFAASVCKGLAAGRSLKPYHPFLAGAWFGFFQALMPLLGFFLGETVERYVDRVDHYVAFLLLLLLGGQMIVSAFSEEEPASADFSVLPMFLMAVATSLDALAVGVTFALEDAPVFLAAGCVGVTTFLLSALGVRLGSLCAGKYRRFAQGAGGATLIALGVRFLAAGLA